MKFLDNLHSNIIRNILTIKDLFYLQQFVEH